MQTINQYHKQQAKQNKQDSIVIGVLFGFAWVLSVALIVIR